jgi:hypothetical protein
MRPDGRHKQLMMDKDGHGKYYACQGEGHDLHKYHRTTASFREQQKARYANDLGKVLMCLICLCTCSCL